MAGVKPHHEGYDITANTDLQQLISERRYRFVLNGHTHKPMLRTFGPLSIINAGTLLRAAEAATRQGSLDEAQLLLERALSLVPDHQVVLTTLAEVLEARGDFRASARALEALAEASLIDSHKVSAWPQAVSFADLCAMTQARLDHAGEAGDIALDEHPQPLADRMLQCFLSNLAELHVHPPRFAASPGERLLRFIHSRLALPGLPGVTDPAPLVAVPSPP